MRRRAMMLLNEEDLHDLLALNPGERVVKAWPDDMRNGIVIGIEGDETTDLPETPPGSEPYRIRSADRPYAMHRLRDRLVEIMAESWQGSHSPEEYRKAVTEAVEREIFPHLRRDVP